jgi:hypothetical protein
MNELFVRWRDRILTIQRLAVRQHVIIKIQQEDNNDKV